MTGRFLGGVRETTAREYDLIVVGGGIHGICLTLEAARRGHAVLLLERGDFASETSSNSLRILHGGLRYLQSLDLERFRESVRARAWFLGHFPELTGTRRFVLPLEGKGLRRPSVFRGAFLLDRELGRRMNEQAGVHSSVLGGGEVFSARDLEQECPYLSGWSGAAVWRDGWLTSQQRLHIEMLRWAVTCGADVCNYASAEGTVDANARIEGVRVRSSVRGVSEAEEFVARGHRVVLTVGPGTSRLLAAWGREQALPSLPTSRAYNVVIEGDLFGENGIALPARDGQNAFMWSADGVTHIGTVHEIEETSPQVRGIEGTRRQLHQSEATSRRVPGDEATNRPLPATPPVVSEESVSQFLSSVSQYVPSLELETRRRLGLTAGRLLSRAADDPEMPHRDLWVEVKELAGLYASVGLKYTTAPEVARTTCDRVLGKRPLGKGRRPASRGAVTFGEIATQLRRAPRSAALNLRQLAAEEGARHLDDLLFRRLDGAVDPDVVLPAARELARIVPSSAGLAPEEEVERVRAELDARQPRSAEGAVRQAAGKRS